MVEIKQISHAEFPKSLCRHSSSKRWNITSHSLCVGCSQWLPSNEHCRGRGKRRKQWVEKSNTTSNQHWWVMVIVGSLDMMWWQWHFSLGVFLPKTLNPSLIMRKPQTNLHWEMFYKILEQYSKQLSSWKVWETVSAERSLRTHDH